MRRYHNSIHNIHDAKGKLVETPDKVILAFTEFYGQLLGTKGRYWIQVDEALVRKGTVLNANQCDILCAPLTKMM